MNFISNLFDINWFFFGIEKFKLTVTRKSILKILSLIMIFMFVKNKSDVWVYTLILSGSTLISQLLLFCFLRNEVYFIIPTFKNLKKHIKPILILFIPFIAVSLYKIMDKIMLGLMSGVVEVGYYEQAEKITNIPLGIITALGTVMFPKITSLVSKGKEEEIRMYLNKSIRFVMFMAFPICFGLISVSDNFVPLFLGVEFEKTIILIYFLSFTILFISFANVLRTQYLVPNEMDKDFVISVILGAVINLIVNLIAIPRYSSIGACLGTILAEFSVMIYQAIILMKILPINKYFASVLPFFIKSLIMFFIVMLINYINMPKITLIMVQICIGVLTYSILNIRYIDSIINLRKILKLTR